MKLQVALDFCKNYQNAKNIIDDIEEYQKKNGIASFTATVLELVRKGLEK